MSCFVTFIIPAILKYWLSDLQQLITCMCAQHVSSWMVLAAVDGPSR